jgi:hypothetical protein
MIRGRLYWLVTWVMSIVMLCLVLGISTIPASAQSQQSPATLVAIRAAYHPEATPRYDRVVFELRGQLPESIRVEYVSKLIADGSGLVVPVKGKGILKLVLSPTNAHTAAGTSTVPGRISYNLPIVREVVRSGDFEAVVSYGIGVSRKTEIRFFTLNNPTRVVIDFLHT